MDADLIRQCAVDSLLPAIVEQFIATAGARSPFDIVITIDGRRLDIPPPPSEDEALRIVRHFVSAGGDVRVGLTRFPAHLAAEDPSGIDMAVIDPCLNVRIGTALFARIYERERARDNSSDADAFARAAAIYFSENPLKE
ncbi:hypothetical protein FHS82_002464 [Pseudochelatococcus lubricantis]|uniref:Uncharacterized protein n=1 Tax=Pseudochelatococcus lubricantis TaxID=1538102 RepID=A0ABX0V088_9HYPH|nr:hypothetical protein [Pseudochelatococcus lubricantis]NIJ58616.1 hypothetical protein [Pseudochelatococcus lubricantis]